MRIRVLGSAAGGGFPQWNCGCSNCKGVRDRSISASPRTQECVAISADHRNWFLLNASPEIRSQIEGFALLHPVARRGSPIRGVILTNADLDHCLGLLSLREWQPLAIFATDRVRSAVAGNNAFFRALQRSAGQTQWHTLETGVELELADASGQPGGILIEAVPAPGKPPAYLENLGTHPDNNIGLKIRPRGGDRICAYFPSVGAITSEVRAAIDCAACLFFDGTFWSNTELRDVFPGAPRAEQMAHLPVGGPEGSLATLSHIDVARRVFIHLNNTNPLLRDDSNETAEARRLGWEIARDGMEIDL